MCTLGAHLILINESRTPTAVLDMAAGGLLACMAGWRGRTCAKYQVIILLETSPLEEINTIFFLECVNSQQSTSK